MLYGVVWLQYLRRHRCTSARFKPAHEGLSRQFVFSIQCRFAHFPVLRCPVFVSHSAPCTRYQQASVRNTALTSGPLWGSACVYHGLVGSASLVADLWGSPQGITLNLSVLGYFQSFERYLFFPHKATCVSRTCVSFPFPTRHNWRVRKISVCRRSATAAAGAA